MKNLFNLIVTFLFLWTGNKYFPESVHIADQKTLILATVLMFVIGYAYGLLMLLSFILIPIGIGCLTIIPLILGMFVLTPIKLIILNHYLEGFQVHGFWTYVIFTVALAMFTWGPKPQSKTTTTI